VTPSFPLAQVKVQTLCNSDEELPIKFSLVQHLNSGTHPVYGSFVSSLKDMRAKQPKTVPLKNERGAEVGSLTFNQFAYVEKPSFTDYLRSGWFINMSCAIDFTASNGEVFEPTSLHKQYTQPNTFNDYEKAILSVGHILEPYAFQQKFAAFGFGGVPRFAGQNSVSHCFNLTGQADPSVIGLAGLF
jgi:hypothetical protein